MFLLMTTVSSAPMDLMSEKQASKSVTEMMSQPLLSLALLQNKTFLSELAKADPGTLNTIMGLLNDLLDASIAASIAFTTDVNTALIDQNAKTTILASATENQTNANNAKTAADSAFTKATSDFDAAVIHHTTMQDELTDKQPGVDAESDTLRSVIASVRTLTPAPGSKLKFQLKGNSGEEKVKIHLDGQWEEFNIPTEWKHFEYQRPLSGQFSVEFLNDVYQKHGVANNDVYIQGHDIYVTDLLPNFGSNVAWECGTANENDRCGSLRDGNLSWGGTYTWTLKAW